MAIQLIYGRAGSGKTRYITECICKRHGESKKSVLAVPEQYTHIAEHKLLTALGSISTGSAEVTSFNKMINRTEAVRSKSVLPPMTKNIIMADILSYIEPEYFKNTVEQSGSAEVFLSLVNEFKKYCVLPQALAEANENIPDKRLQLKLNDIIKIYEEYIRRIGEKGFDSQDGASVLAKSISESASYGDTVFFFDEYTSFIPQELEIIKQLALKAEDVYITLCTDGKDEILFAPIAHTAEKIRAMCAESGIELKKPIIISENRKHNEELAFLEANLLPYPKRKYESDCEMISVFSAANPYAEVEDTARRIVRLCRDGGYRYRDIAVVCSDIGAYAPFIRPIFAKSSIECFIDEKSDVINHRIVCFVLNIIDIYLNDYSLESIMAFLKSGFCGADTESVFVLENYCKSTNMYKSTWLNDEKWNDLLLRVGLEPEDAERICRVRSENILPLAELHNSIKGRHTVEHMCREVYNYLVKIDLPAVIEKHLKLFEENGDIFRCEEYERIWNIITDALGCLAEIIGEKAVNVKEFRSLLQTAFSNYKIGSIPTSLDQVFVGNISRSRTDGIKVLFVLGANDGLFPASVTADEIINDNDKALLAQGGVELAVDSKTKAFFERFSMYSVFTVPSERLFVSFSRSDSSSATLRPSFAIGDFKRVFPDLKIESDVLEDGGEFGQMEYISAKAPTLEKMTEKLTLFKDGEKISPVWFDVYKYFCDNYDFGTKLKKYYGYTNLPSPIDSDTVSDFMGDEFFTTVSRLQRYRSCKFSYFIEYILKLRENNEFDITAMDTGSFVHGAIERLCRDMGHDGYDFKNVTDEYIYAKIDVLIDEFINKLSSSCARITKRCLYLIKRLRGSIFRCFCLIKEHIAESLFEPLGYEMRFDDDNIGCINLKLSNGKCAKLTGVIDRSDIYRSENGDYVRVIDYKTGSKTFSLTDVFYGLDIQLFVYLNALVASNDGYRYGGALYFRIDDPFFRAENKYEEEKTESKLLNELKMKGLLLDEEKLLAATDSATASSAKKATYENFVNLDKHLRKTVSDLCEEMAKGEIDIKPYNKQKLSPCRYCGYKSICRFDVNKKDNFYNYLDKMSDEEIWNMLGGDENVD